jgi:thiamine pyrophosphate-dependent acetolactate synthase large subunit-like protein
MEALRKRQDKVRFIQVRHEEAAAFAACAYAKYTGGRGVCPGTSGPGAFARACGGTGFTIDDPESCGEILEQALRTPGPVIVDAVADPDEPPMPARIEPDQALKLVEAFAKGTPSRGRIA